VTPSVTESAVRDAAEGLLRDQNRALELIVTGAPLTAALEELVWMVESRIPDLRVSVLLVDDDGKRLLHGTAPSLPDSYNEAIDGIEIGACAGSCGTAAHRRERVVVADIEHDPLWADYREPARDAGVRACWSTPILSPDGLVLGTFAIYYDRVQAPRAHELELVDLVARTASIAIARRRLEREREQTLRVVQTLHQVGRAVASRVDLHDIVQVVTDVATDVTGAQLGAFFYNVVRAGGETHTLYTVSGVRRETFARFPLPRRSKIFEPTLKGESIVRLDDASADPRFVGLPEGHPPVRSYLAAPVVDPEGEVLGGLFFGHSDTGRFTAEDEEIVGGIAAQAAIAIVNSRLYEAEQRARAEAERRARAAFSLEHIDNGVALVDMDSTIRVWNRAAAGITGVAAEEAVGKRLDELVGGWDEATDQLRRSTVTATSQTVPVDVRGREAWLEVSATRFEGGIVFAFKDVTDERRLDSMRSDLIATVSHELRTPVTAVYGAVKTLERDDVRGNPDLSDRLFEIVKSESTRLVQLVEEILLSSRIDNGTLELDAEGVDVLDVVHETVASFSAAGTHVHVEGPPARALADRHRLHQVLDNLVDNALKYGGDHVDVSIAMYGDEVRVAVVDDGPGISSGDRGRVFEKFVRLDPNMRTGVNGTGLGLYIGRELVERMGGRMWVDDRPDGKTGSMFVVALPAC
jgi:PAS domain S-box-containing protein